jgi:hypothetical protein
MVDDANKENPEENPGIHAAAMERKRINTYRTLMRRAGMTKSARKHLEHLTNMQASENMPYHMGQVSRELYDTITGARKFDRYHRMVSTKLSKKQQLITNLAATLAGQSDSGEQKEDKLGRAKAVDKLHSSQLTIGFKANTFGPPGLRQPLCNVSNSEGNEKFFSYDGSWKDGEMHGYGTYRYADGMKYIGAFECGMPSGDGVAEYSGGGRYEGAWVDGRYNGQGTMEYVGGITYTGEWKHGKRHGHGRLQYPSGVVYDGGFQFGRMHGRAVMTSPKVGFQFTGTFEKGFVNGTGRLVWPDGKADARDFRSLGGMTFKGLIDFLHDELAHRAEAKTEERDAVFSVRLAVQLVDHVDEVRLQVREERRERRDMELEAKRARQREEREKAKAARLAALASDNDEEDS